MTVNIPNLLWPVVAHGWRAWPCVVGWHQWNRLDSNFQVQQCTRCQQQTWNP